MNELPALIRNIFELMGELMNPEDKISFEVKKNGSKVIKGESGDGRRKRIFTQYKNNTIHEQTILKK